MRKALRYPRGFGDVTVWQRPGMDCPTHWAKVTSKRSVRMGTTHPSVRTCGLPWHYWMNGETTSADHGTACQGRPALRPGSCCLYLHNSGVSSVKTVRSSLHFGCIRLTVVEQSQVREQVLPKCVSVLGGGRARACRSFWWKSAAW